MPIRVWDWKTSHTRMGRPIRVQVIPYAYGTIYAYGTEHMHRNQWEVTKVSILANFVNCEDIIKAVFIAFMPNNVHIDTVFPWKWCYFIAWGRSTSYYFFLIRSVDKRPRMTLCHALLMISHGTQYMQGISTTVQGTFTVETAGLLAITFFLLVNKTPMTLYTRKKLTK